MPEALSADGRTVVFAEVLTGSGSAQVAYLRKTDGSDAVRLGDGFPEDLSSDGRSVLVAIRSSKPPRWVILPTGPGEAKPLSAGDLEALREANFLPDGKRIAFGGVAPGQQPRIYVQDLSDGVPRPISPEGVATDGLATPDGRFVLGWSQGRTRSIPWTRARRGNWRRSRRMTGPCSGARTVGCCSCGDAARGRRRSTGSTWSQGSGSYGGSCLPPTRWVSTTWPPSSLRRTRNRTATITCGGFPSSSLSRDSGEPARRAQMACQP